jgi:hypothetical protein
MAGLFLFSCTDAVETHTYDFRLHNVWWFCHVRGIRGLDG